MRRLFLFAFAILAVTVPYSFAGSSSSTTYYVSPSGSDSNSGTASAPWQTIARVNRASLQPGDTVLFQGGQTCSRTRRSRRPASGTAPAPISFGSYGAGRAQLNNAIDVWIPPAEHDLTFTNLDYTGSQILFASAASGSGTYNITISDSAFHDTPQAAINIAQHQDHNWNITNSTFTHTGDSAIFIWGSNDTISHCTITDTGWNPAITWGTHGIYDKGPDNTIADNDISNDSRGQAISIRFHGARVYGNTIHDTPYGIAFFDYDTTIGPQGTSYIYDNRLWNINGYGFYYSNQTDPQGNPPTVNFVLASNTFTFNNSNEAINVSETPPGANITLANNIFTGSYGSAYRGCPTCTENNNDWYGANTNIPNGERRPARQPEPFGRHRGARSASGSSVIDAGTSTVAGLSYVAACDGAPLHYCGTKPDQGAGEAQSGTTAPVTTPPTTTPPTTTPPTTTSGPSGASGVTGPSGASGVRGASGASGPAGSGTGGTAQGGTTPPAAGSDPGTDDGHGVVTPDPTTPLPAAPASVNFTATRGGGRLSWLPQAGDTGFRVLVNGNVIATTATPMFRFHRLGCNATFTVGVAAVNPVGNVSPTVEISAHTAPCSRSSLTHLGREAARGGAHGTTFRKSIKVLKQQYARRSSRT